jgi:hypothetical protein
MFIFIKAVYFAEGILRTIWTDDHNGEHIVLTPPASSAQGYSSAHWCANGLGKPQRKESLATATNSFTQKFSIFRLRRSERLQHAVNTATEALQKTERCETFHTETLTRYRTWSTAIWNEQMQQEAKGREESAANAKEAKVEECRLLGCYAVWLL